MATRAARLGALDPSSLLGCQRRSGACSSQEAGGAAPGTPHVPWSSVELFSGESSLRWYLAVWSGVRVDHVFGKSGILCDRLQTNTKSCGSGTRIFGGRFAGNRTTPRFFRCESH